MKLHINQKSSSMNMISVMQETTYISQTYQGQSSTNNNLPGFSVIILFLFISFVVLMILSPSLSHSKTNKTSSKGRSKSIINNEFDYHSSHSTWNDSSSCYSSDSGGYSGSWGGDGGSCGGDGGGCSGDGGGC